jgi:hypothetical protein
MCILASSSSNVYGFPGQRSIGLGGWRYQRRCLDSVHDLCCAMESSGLQPGGATRALRWEHRHRTLEQLNGGYRSGGQCNQVTVPTIANGKVYIGTAGNNASGVSGSTTVSGEPDVTD